MQRVIFAFLALSVILSPLHSAISQTRSGECGKRDNIKITGWGSDWSYINIDTSLHITDSAGGAVFKGEYLEVGTGPQVSDFRIRLPDGSVHRYGAGENDLIHLGTTVGEIRANISWCMKR